MAQDLPTPTANATDPALPPRQALLLAELQRSNGELSGQDLHARLRGSPGAMGLATVYRHLRLLQQRGVVRCRHLPSGEALYAPCDRDEHHLTCVDCGRTRLLSRCPVHDVHLHDGDLAGFVPLFHTLEFFGLCEACRSRQGAT
ncbi:MAG: transcriptional repressor [Cyanobacteriota bacterium]|nr:transcriptional repressor [Cyanobacteriota bacterium]